LIFSKKYSENDELNLEKRIIISKKIKEGNAYPIIPILVGINITDFNKFFFSKFDLNVIEYSGDIHDQAILDVETYLNNFHSN
jgi:hypothetical protein